MSNKVSNKNSKNTPILSVVMPVHNPHQYLAPCLDSVLRQTFRDFELIAIDDASSDDSYNVLSGYADRDNRLKILYNEQSLGAARTRNIGLYTARGKYIIFLDADDFFEHDYFMSMIDAIESNHADVAICSILRRDERNGNEEIISVDLSSPICQNGQSFSPSEYHNGIFYDMPYAPFNKLVRKDFLLKKRIEFQDISNSNDVYFGVMVVAEAERVVYLPTPYIHYRYNTGCQISTNRRKNPFCICYAFKKIREEFISRDLWGKYGQMYHDTLVTQLTWAVRGALEPNSLLDYIRGEGGVELGLLNLRRSDFSSVQYYSRYKLLIYGKKAILNNMSDVLTFTMNSLVRGEFSIVCWLLYLCGRSILHKRKKLA